MMNQLETSTDENEKYVHLYLCDGTACSEDEKKCCWTLGLPPNLTCRHTTDEKHSIIKQFNGIIKTHFQPLYEDSHVLVENIDQDFKNKFEKFLDETFKPNESKDIQNHVED